MRDVYILGINPTINYFSSHDSSACLLHNGKIIAAAEEERFTRVKHATRTFPLNAIKFCLEFADITLDDLECIALPTNPDYCRMHFNFLRERVNPVGRAIWTFRVFRWFIKKGFHSSSAIEKMITNDVRKKIKNDKVNLHFSAHHLSHAASTFYCSGFKNASIITLDGIGESGLREATVLWEGNGNEINKLENYFSPNSLGLYYELFCQQLGFSKLDGPGKVMGLAPYGKNPSEVMPIFEKKLKTELPYDVTNFSSWVQLQRIFGKRREGELTSYHENIAFMVQHKLEKIALNLVNKNFENTNSKNLCLAGGVALNCIMNGKLLRSENVENIFIQPAAGDNGLCIGAALNSYYELGYKPHTTFESVYLGPSFSNEEIKKELKNYKLKENQDYEYHDDIAGITAELLAKDKVVGWFQGRMEFGPRALGNRSILANPTHSKMKDIVNAKVKHREMWRPFCPSLLDQSAKEYLEGTYPSPYMILAFDVKEEKVKEIPAVVHVDGTTRPQTVSKKTNPLYYKLIEEFESETGIPVILNTSFNVAGEPIVCRPEEAIKDFLNTQMDYLVLGNYLVSKG